MSENMNKDQYRMYSLQNDSNQLWNQLKRDIQDDIIEAAKSLENELPHNNHTVITEYYTIRKLGYDDFKTNIELENTWRQKKLSSTILSIANLTDNFSIRLEYKDSCYNLSIGVHGITKDMVEHQLQANYGYVNLINSHANIIYDNTQYSKFTRIPKSNMKDSADEPIQNKLFNNWVTAVTNINNVSDFTIEFQFHRINQDSISNQIKILKSHYENLSKLEKNSIQISTQSSTTNTNGKIIPPFIQRANLTEAQSSNYSVNMDLINIDIKLLIPQIENELLILEESNKQSSWNIFAFVSCNKKTVNHTVKAIINTTANMEEYYTTWCDNTPVYGSPVASVDLHKFAKMPENDFVGFEFIQNENFNIQLYEKGDITLGNILRNNTKLNQNVYLNYNDLTRHAFVCGMTGSGKTNTVFHILSNSNKPFLVIEPVKTEYRDITVTNENINVHTMDGTDNNALSINPFWFSENASLQYHIDGIKTIITSAFSLYAAMPNILEQCLYNIYIKCGWNFATGKNVYMNVLPEKYLYPTFDSLYYEIENYLEKSDYTGDTLSAYKGALLTRIKSFTSGIKGMLLNTNQHPDYNNWFTSNQIIELDALSDDADKAIVMGTILIQYFQYLKMYADKEESLKHILIIEEAHRLFKNITNNDNPEIANSSGQLSEMLTNMMAEIRAYGEGIIVVDQSPSKISIDVIKNSNIKIVHRLDSKDDINLIEQSLLLENSDIVISTLSRGEALIRFENVKKPIKAIISKNKGFINNETENIKFHHNIKETNWKSSPMTDLYLQIDDFVQDLYFISNKIINSILFDSMTNINMIIKTSMEQIHNLLLSYGLSIGNIENSAYNNLILYGVNMVLTKDELFRNNYKFHSLLDMMVERILLIYYTENITPKEILIFETYRKNSLYNLLTSMFLCNRTTGIRHRNIANILGKDSIYSSLICMLSDFYEREGLLKEEINYDLDNLIFFTKTHCDDLFMTPPNDIVISNITQQLFCIIKIVKEAHTSIEQID